MSRKKDIKEEPTSKEDLFLAKGTIFGLLLGVNPEIIKINLGLRSGKPTSGEIKEAMEEIIGTGQRNTPSRPES